MTARPAKNPKSPVVIESDFKRHMLALSHDEQRRCFVAIRWFEYQCSPKDRKQRSMSVEGASRRRLRFITASKDLRVIYSVEGNDERRWVWAGRYDNLASASVDLDRPSVARAETIDVDTMLEWVRGHIAVAKTAEAQAAAVQGDVVPSKTQTVAEPSLISEIKAPQNEVDLLIAAADNATMFVTDARSVVDSIMEKLRKRIERERTERDEKVVVESERETELDEDKEKEKKPEITVSLAKFNEISRANEILTEKLRVAEKRASANEFTGSQVEQIRRMAAEENRSLKRSLDQQRSESAALRVALEEAKKSALSGVLSEKIREDLKDKCAKVLDDQARILGMTGRPALVEQAEELGRLAIRIRALKL